MLDFGPNTLDKALGPRVLPSTSGEQEEFGSQQGTPEPPVCAKQAEILKKLKNILMGGKVGMKV